MSRHELSVVNAQRSRARLWMAIAIGWVALAGAIAVWIGATPIARLREQLAHAQFWSLEALAALLVVCTVAQIRPIGNVVRELSARTAVWRPMIACCALALTLTAFVAPRTSRIYYDEQIYQGIAQSMSDLHRATMCHEGIVEYGRLQCQRDEYNKQPNGFPYILSVAYRVFGVGAQTGTVVNNLCAALLPLVVFLLTLLLAEDARAAAFAALIVALIPEQLLWSNTSASEPSAALFSACAVLAAAGFARVRTTGALCWAVAATAFAVQFRPECLLIVPIVVAVATSGHADEWRQPRWWAGGLLGVALCAALIAHLAAVRNEPWGADGPRMAWSYLRGNLAVNGPFYFTNARWPVLYTALAVAAVLGFRPRRATHMLLAYFALFWGVFLFFYAGSYNYGADVRYSLMSGPPIAALAGMGAAGVVRWLDDRARGPLGGAAVVSAAILAQFLWFMPLVRAVGEEAWASRADVRVALELAGELPPNSIVLSHNPAVFLVSGANAAQTSFAVDDPRWVTALHQRFAGGVYFYWNFWCNVPDPVQNRFCTDMLEKFPATLLAERRERTYRYAWYRIERQ